MLVGNTKKKKRLRREDVLSVAWGRFHCLMNVSVVCVVIHMQRQAGHRYPFFSLATEIHKRRGIPSEHMCRKGSLVFDKRRGLIVIP